MGKLFQVYVVPPCLNARVQGWCPSDNIGEWRMLTDLTLCLVTNRWSICHKMLINVNDIDYYTDILSIRQFCMYC